MRSTVSILFYLKYGSRSVDGRLPLMCRITIDGESTSFSCKMRVPPEKWDARQNALVGDDEESEQTNRMIDELRQQLLSAYTRILHEYGSVRPKWLKEYTMGTPSRQEMLLFFFTMHNENFRTQIGHGRSLKTYQRYVVVYGHLRSFLRKHYQLEDVRVKYVTLTMVTAFEQYLRVDRKLKNNTVWAYMITFKHIISLARVHGLIRSNPFAGYKNHFEQVDRGYLTEPELQRLMLLPLEEGTQRRYGTCSSFRLSQDSRMPTSVRSAGRTSGPCSTARPGSSRGGARPERPRTSPCLRSPKESSTSTAARMRKLCSIYPATIVAMTI